VDTGGYAGKILHLDLTRRTATAIETEKYRRWGGGHGMGAAVFWDFCKDKTISFSDLPPYLFSKEERAETVKKGLKFFFQP
jgi:aldehyde:ferredoxin oxidoreductase